MEKTSFFASAGVALVALAVTVGTGSGCGVGDQYCYQDSDPLEPDDDCPYGPPGGPVAAKDQVADFCPDPDFTNPMNCGTATWEAVYAVFSDDAIGGCSKDNCHGIAPGKKAFYFPAGNPVVAYDGLGTYLYEGKGEPYARLNDPSSWIVCNVTGLPGSAAMPPSNGLIDPGDVQLVRDWASCGFPGPGGGATTGAGGGGGVGGAGM
jgi:hypothetical protein